MMSEFEPEFSALYTSQYRIVVSPVSSPKLTALAVVRLIAFNSDGLNRATYVLFEDSEGRQHIRCYATNVFSREIEVTQKMLEDTVEQAILLFYSDLGISFSGPVFANMGAEHQIRIKID